MCTRVERIAQVDPDGWYAPVIGQELIRCKDCKHFIKSTKTAIYTGECLILEGGADEDCFCSWAERKSE